MNTTPTYSNAANVLPSVLDVTCHDYKCTRERNVPHVLLDVRSEKQFDMCALPGAINIPLARISDELDRIERLASGGTNAIYCICRRGVASAEAARLLAGEIENSQRNIQSVRNVAGGLNAWRRDVDPSFPKY